ncbi:MAG: tRNA uridine-5-carboxymethylaminomethyl(34) synthesis GTPase MnmE [Defluviitaleaceae bacterium]|nr:tRNA uridine-5-carboxymethylaminomethyl(34) synthesis GTPase MnmE [Defluviitaleaceae bacterium]
MITKDVIAAIATAPGQGAIGIVRISGDGAFKVLGRMFSVARYESHRMYYGKIHKDGALVDEVMVCPMAAPKTYTSEDVVEIYTHGGMLVLHAVLDTALFYGARLAEPGEFTKRAFLNGRINITQAEAVMDVISATSEAARVNGLSQLGGGLGRQVEKIRDKILLWLAHIELSIDYPEHEDEAQNMSEILAEAGDIITQLERLAGTAKIGRMLKEGVKTAIIGRPNVGKSTLLNAILREDRAIVHQTPGTTRDVLTEHVLVNDVPLILMDTAGIRQTEDSIEKIGVEKSLQAAQEAELVLYVVDKQNGILPQDEEMLDRLEGKHVVLVVNKCDLNDGQNRPQEAGEATPHSAIQHYPPPVSADSFEADALSEATSKSVGRIFRPTDSDSGLPPAEPGMADSITPNTAPCTRPALRISALNREGLEELYGAIGEIFMGGIEQNDSIITRERHVQLVAGALGHLKTAADEIVHGTPEDLVAIELRSAYLALGEMLGVEIGDDVVDRIFAEFCLGK